MKNETNMRLKDPVFQKYTSHGSYHWGAISRNPRKHQPIIAARYRICLELLGSVTNKDVLDFGCGDGALAGLITKAGGQIVGVDPNGVGLELAKDQFSRHQLKGQFYPSTSHLPESQFDAIVCAEVIEHVTNPEGILQEIDRLLKPNGIAIISTPIRLAEEVLDKEHYCEYFPSEFQNLCERYFEIVEMRHELPVALHEILRICGVTGWLLHKSVKVLSAWFNWNYLLEIKGNYRLYLVQFAKLRSRKNLTSLTNI